MREGILKSTNIAGIVLLFMAIGLFLGPLSLCSDMDQTKLLVRTFGIAGTFIAFLLLIAAIYHKPLDKYIKYIISMGIGYMLCYYCLVICYQLYRGIRFQYFYGNLEDKMVDVSVGRIYYTLVSHLPYIQYFTACIMAIGALLLLYRATRKIAVLILLPLLGFSYIINSQIGMCNSLRSGVMLSLAIFLFVQNWEWLFHLLMNKPYKSVYPLGNSKKYYQSAGFLKILLVSGVLVYTHYKHGYFDRFRAETPISGVWNIVDYDIKNKEDKQVEAFLNSQSLFFEKGRNAFVKHDDSLTRFHYLFDSLHKQFDMYGFLEFKELDFKGKFDLLENDTLLFYGMNNKDSLTIKLLKDLEYERTIE